MAQQSWTLNTGNGRQHLIGLYHGEESGHLAVYCNNQIILVDFHVRAEKRFSFFVDEELCELTILPAAVRGFQYQLVLNEQADTPRNQRRKALAAAQEKDRKEWIWRLVFGLAAVLFVLALILLAFFRGR
ncbi:MAG: hypothetical protein IPI11_07865 [Haliscomenobacter sp.]|nr:hypothetical protein [Haliscomenobacter sp.]